MSDNVNAPSHYCTGKFECIDVMEEVFGKEAVEDFCICNAFKYLYRKNKKNGIEDIQKAQWYLNKYLALEGVSATNMKYKPEDPTFNSCNDCKFVDCDEHEEPCRNCKYNKISYYVYGGEEA